MTTKEIHNDIINEASDDEILSALSSTSKASISRNFFFNIAYAIKLFIEILNNHYKEVKNILSQERIGTKNWYKNRILDFQYGFDLIIDTDRFDNNNVTQEEIEASKIIKHAAVVEPSDDSSLIIKIATGENDLKPVNEDQQNAVEQYLEEIRFAGTRATLINQAHDQLYLTVDIYRDPLQIDVNGTNIRTGERSIEKAINTYLKSKLPFNGQLTVQALADEIQQVEGVEIVDVINVESNSINSAGEYGDPISINVRHIPVSGYYRVVNFDNVRYVV